MKRLRQYVVTLVVMLLFVACQSWRPWGVMNPSEMEEVLYDIHLTEGMISAVYPNMRREDQRASYDAIFEKHGVTRQKFEKSLVWYSAHPDKFSPIYDSLDVRFTTLVNDVKAYKFHDEMSHLLKLDTLSKVNIYGFEIHKNFNAVPDASDVSFEVNDARLLAEGDRYVWRFYLTPLALDTVRFDTLPNTRIRFCVDYANGTCDSVSHPICANGKRRRLTITAQCTDTLTPVRIRGSFFDGRDQVASLRIDSATLMRYYDARRHPLSEEVLEILDSIAITAHRRMSVSATVGRNPFSMGFDSRAINVTPGAKEDDRVRLPQRGEIRKPGTQTKHTDN